MKNALGWMLTLSACATVAAGAPAPSSRGTLHVEVLVPEERGVCVVYAQHIVLDGQDTIIASAPADGCGFPSCTLRLRNELEQAVVLESIVVDGRTTTDFDTAFSTIDPGAERSWPVHAGAGEHHLVAFVRRGEVRSTEDADFVVLPARVETIDR